MIATFTFTAYSNFDAVISQGDSSHAVTATVRDVIFGYHLPEESRLSHSDDSSRIPDVIKRQFTALLKTLERLDVKPSDCCYVETFRTNDVATFLRQLSQPDVNNLDQDDDVFTDITTLWQNDDMALGIGCLVEMTDSAETFEWVRDDRPLILIQPQEMTFIMSRDRTLDFNVRAVEVVADVNDWASSERLTRKYDNFVPSRYPTCRIIKR